MSAVVIIVADNTSPVKKNFPSISQNGDDKMGNICQYAYSFDRNLKSESFGIITDEKNYGGNKKSICAAAREMLSKSTETLRKVCRLENFFLIQFRLTLIELWST